MWRSEVNTGGLPHSLPILFFVTDVTESLTDSAGLSAQQALLSATPVPELQVDAAKPRGFLWGFWGIRLEAGSLPTEISSLPHDLRLSSSSHVSSLLTVESTCCRLGEHLPSPLQYWSGPHLRYCSNTQT